MKEAVLRDKQERQVNKLEADELEIGGPCLELFPRLEGPRSQLRAQPEALSPEAFTHPEELCGDRRASWWGRTWGRGGQPLGRVPPLPSPIFPSTGEVTRAPRMEEYGCSLLHDHLGLILTIH